MESNLGFYLPDWIAGHKESFSLKDFDPGLVYRLERERDLEHLKKLLGKNG